MRSIGFSTGALAFGDFVRALDMLRGKSANAVELSALRTHELPKLVEGVGALDLKGYNYISVHAPSSFTEEEEPHIIDQLKHFARRGWPIVLHPDAIHRIHLWGEFGELLYIENMDKRKPLGRNVAELSEIFSELPKAQFCFDMAHVRQVDSSMTEAYLILRAFGGKLRQLHISEVNTSSKHDRISRGAFRAFREIAHLIPSTVPAILESLVSQWEIDEELDRAERSLRPETAVPAWSSAQLALQ